MDYLSSYGLPPKTPPDALAAAEALAAAAGGTSTEADPLARLREEIDALAAKTRIPSSSWTGDLTQDEAKAQISSLRYNVSLLSEVSAQLAVALNERTHQYETLVSQVAGGVLTPTRGPEIPAPTPELINPMAEVETLKAANTELEAQLEQRSMGLDDLKVQLEAALAERDALDADKASLEMQVGGQESQIIDLEIQVSALMGDLEAYEHAKADFEAQAADFNQEIADLTEQLAIAQTHADEMGAGRVELETQIQDRDTELETLTAGKLDLETQLAALLASKSDLETQLGTRQVEWDDLQQQVSVLQAELQPFIPEEPAADETANTAVEAGADAAVEAGADAAVDAGADATVDAVVAPVSTEKKTGLGAVSAAVAILLAKLKQQEDDLGATATRASDIAVQLDTLQPQLDALNADKASLEGSIQEKESALAALQAQLDALNADKASLDIAIQEKDSAAADLQANFDAQQEQLDALAAHNSNLESSVQDKDNALAELQAQLEVLTADKTGLEASMQEKDSAAAAMQSDLTMLNTTVDTLNANIAETQAQVDALTAEKATLEATIQEKDETIASLQADLATSKTTIDNLNAQIATLNTQIEGLTQQVEEGQAQITALNEQVGSLSQEPEEGREDRDGRLAAVTAGAAASAALIKRHEGDLETADVTSLQAQIDALTADKGALETVLQEKEQAAADLQAQLASVQAANDALAQVTAERDELAARVEGLQIESDAALQERVAEPDDSRAQLAAPTVAAAAVAEPAGGVEVEVAGDAGELAAAVAAEAGEGETGAVTEEPQVALSSTVVNLKAGATRAAFTLGTKPSNLAQPQDLTNIEGIGSTYENRLYQAGIGTYWEVANLSDEGLFEVLQVGARRAMMDAEAIRMSAFQLAQSSNTLGRLWTSQPIDDFEQIPGISQTYEQRLYEAGIYTYRALADSTVEQLEALIESPASFRPPFERWITSARERLGSDE